MATNENETTPPPSDTDAMVFENLAPVRVPITIGTKQYVLQEADEGQVLSWRNAGMRGMKVVKGDVVGFHNVADSDAELLRSCLFEVNARGDGKDGPVAIGFIRGMKHTVFDPIFTRLKKISGLNRKEEVEDAGPKGESSSTGDTSASATNSDVSSTS